ncbi:MAG TPA: radical SAM protein [Xanthomonadales bacterium]|nr:radical SAM protein [Xanthomonadales bacterium]
MPDRIIHLHPTLQCNLACTHCYSESDPWKKTALDPEELIRGLQLLRAEGYSLISFSGGEPLVYRALAKVVKASKGLGYRVSMISNGLLVTARNQALLSLFDGIAISFDGMAQSHNAIRGRPDAFDRASSAIRWLADNGMPCAAAISLTRDAIPELPDLADHLVNCGARALQIRPVARAGRARTLDDDVFYSAADRARLYLVQLALQQELGDKVKVHCDLALARGLWQQRERYAGLLASCESNEQAGRPLADLVNPLVITETGVLKPIAYDFEAGFDLGNLAGLTVNSLSAYKQGEVSAFRQLVGQALAGLKDSTSLVDWFDHCTRLSEKQAIAPPDQAKLR